MMLNMKQILEALTEKVRERHEENPWKSDESEEDLKKAIAGLAITVSTLETTLNIVKEMRPHISKFGSVYKKTMDTLTNIVTLGLFPPEDIENDDFSTDSEPGEIDIGFDGFSSN